ncbi:MAG: ComEA family DNA-binding protein, partial [Ruminococcus sp.]
YSTRFLGVCRLLFQYNTSFQGEATVSEALKSDSEEASPYAELGSSASKPSISSQSPLNINTCSEEELTALPGLNIIDAKRTISLREQNGDFESIEDFITALHIKPHIAAPLYDYITVEPSFKTMPQRTARTRKIDL